MKVYGWAVSPWMARALVCLEEAGVEYEVVPMSRCGGDHRRPEHLARNVRTLIPFEFGYYFASLAGSNELFAVLQPFGEIPVLEDGDLTLYRNKAILTC
jgi:glutathione S-transferase